MLDERDHTESPDSTGETTEALPLPSKAAHRSGGRRTHRACDRCRVKKSKCNGQQPCNTCKANERTCVFSALRRRDIRKWHCHMQDTVDEAIQRLYRACKECACFPGILPEERDGYVTTEQILQGMGFTNLDLGPRTGNVAGLSPLQILPVRSQFSDMSLEQDPSRDSHVYHDHRMNPNSNNEPGSVDTVMPAAQPHAHAEYHATNFPHDRYPGRSQTPSLTMSDQFFEALRQQGPPQDVYHQQVSNQHYHSPFPHPPQHVTRDNQMEQPDMVSRDQIQLTSGPGFQRGHLPLNYREQYQQPQFLVYDREHFITPQQIWQGSTEIAAASQ